MKSSFEARPYLAHREFVPSATRGGASETSPEVTGEPDPSELAYARGRDEARAEIGAELREPVASAIRALEETLEQLRALHGAESEAVSNAIVELALAVASRLIEAELRSDAEAFAPLIAQAFAEIASNEMIHLELSATDAAQVLEGERPEIDRLRQKWNAVVVSDASLRPGEAVVRSGAASIDLRLAAVLERFRSEFAEAATGEPS